MARAVYEYFVNNTPVENTIKGCNDVLDFCISRKSDKKFKIELHTIENGKKKIDVLQKTNRFYISNTGGSFFTRDIEKGRLTGLFVGHNVRILNDYNPEKPLKSYDINFDWYIREAKEAIEDVEPSVVQLSLFDFGNTDLGKKTKMAVPMIAQERPAPKIKVKEKDVKEAHKTKTTFKVPANYFTVTKIYRNEKSSTLKLYWLSKGTSDEELRIDTKLLDKSKITEGCIIFTNVMTKKPKWIKTPVGFEKVEGQFVWWLESCDVFTPKEFIERNEL